jgi:hypothetical protein
MSHPIGNSPYRNGYLLGSVAVAADCFAAWNRAGAPEK